MSVANASTSFDIQALTARNTLNQVVQASCHQYPDRPALVLGKPSSLRTLSYRDMAEQVYRVTSALDYLGVRRGDAVVVVGGGGISWVSLYLAVLNLGAMLVPLPTDLPADTFTRILDETGATLAVAGDQAALDHLAASLGHSPRPRYVVLVDGHSQPNTLGWADLQALGAQHAISDMVFRRMWSSVPPSDRALLLYVYGPDADLRGVELTHRNLLSSVEALRDVFPWTERDVCLPLLPLGHPVTQVAGLFAPLSAGASVVLNDSDSGVENLCHETRPTLVVGEPCLFADLYHRLNAADEDADDDAPRVFRWAVNIGRRVARAEMRGRRPDPTTGLRRALADRLVFRELRDRLGGHVRYLLSAGTGLPASILEFFHGGGLPLLEIYGSEETSGLIACHHPRSVVPGTVGRPAPGCEVMIADDSEILCRGRHVSRSYWNRPGASRKVFTEDGWFRTGDLGSLDNSGNLVVHGRRSDVIHLDGRPLYPDRIERRMRSSPYIEDAILLPCGRSDLAVMLVPAFERLQEEFNAPADHTLLAAHPAVRTLLEKEVERLSGQEDGLSVRRVHVLAESIRPSRNVPVDRQALAERLDDPSESGS